MPVGAMLEQMTSWELTAWQAFFPAAQEREAEQQRRARAERAILGDE